MLGRINVFINRNNSRVHVHKKPNGIIRVVITKSEVDVDDDVDDDDYCLQRHNVVNFV